MRTEISKTHTHTHTHIYKHTQAGGIHTLNASVISDVISCRLHLGTIVYNKIQYPFYEVTYLRNSRENLFNHRSKIANRTKQVNSKNIHIDQGKMSL